MVQERALCELVMHNCHEATARRCSSHVRVQRPTARTATPRSGQETEVWTSARARDNDLVTGVRSDMRICATRKRRWAACQALKKYDDAAHCVRSEAAIGIITPYQPALSARIFGAALTQVGIKCDMSLRERLNTRAYFCSQQPTPSFGQNNLIIDFI